MHANAVTTAKIADDAVTLAKMAGLAKGNIIYGDASGDPASVNLGAVDANLVGDSVWTALLGFPVASDMTRSVRDPYELIDFRASLIGEKLSLTLWGRNITDEEYLAEVIPAPEFGGSFIHEAPYATYGIDLKYNF